MVIKNKSCKWIIVLSVYTFILILLSLNKSSKFILMSGTISGFNIIPFVTIKEYIVHSQDYNVDIIIKFFANIFYLVPLAIYYKFAQNNFKSFFLYFPLISIASDLIPRMLMQGVFDIDAVILRFLGAAAIYFILFKFENKIKS